MTQLFDLEALEAEASRLHNKKLEVKGIVAAVTGDGALLEMVPLSSKGASLLVEPGHGLEKFPTDCVGKTAIVSGFFYNKVYPSYRLKSWQEKGWRKNETLPERVLLHRMLAHEISYEDGVSQTAETLPLSDFSQGVIDLQSMEFESGGMGTGRKTLAAGESTPEHSTGRYHELIIGLEGALVVEMASVSSVLRVTPGKAVYVPPHTKHLVKNQTSAAAAYQFVYGIPEQ